MNRELSVWNRRFQICGLAAEWNRRFQPGSCSRNGGQNGGHKSTADGIRSERPRFGGFKSAAWPRIEPPNEKWTLCQNSAVSNLRPGRRIHDRRITPLNQDDVVLRKKWHSAVTFCGLAAEWNRRMRDFRFKMAVPFNEPNHPKTSNSSSRCNFSLSSLIQRLQRYVTPL